MSIVRIAAVFAAGFLVSSVAWAGGDPAQGKAAFGAVCATCHSVQPDQNKIGPTLFGVYGRQSGGVAGYSYSAASKGAALTWNEATLNTYLESPKTVIPGTKMTYAGVKDAQKRADLIAYLQTLK
jgi:cytochrome c